MRPIEDQTMSTTRPVPRGQLWRRTGVLALAVCVLSAVVLTSTSAADAAACSTSTGASSCSMATSTTITAGTLTLTASPNLYWSFTSNGYDQAASGSATALTGCTASGAGTACSGGSAPKLAVVDATGASGGWSLSAYVSSSNLPAGSVLGFNGAGSATIGNSAVVPISTAPFAAVTPATVCDYASSCTNASAAASCSHSSLGFSSCPAYAVNLLAGTSATAQVDLYSAAAGTGAGAICFGTGSATATGCAGTAPDAFFNLGVKGNAAVGTYTGAVINLTASTGP